MSMIFFYIIAGACTGLLAGLFGIGGGMVIVSTLIYLFTMQGMDSSVVTHIAVGTSLAAIVVTSISSMRAHNSRGGVNWNIWKNMVPGLVVGSLFGAWIASMVNGQALQGVIGVGAILIALKMLFVKTAKLEENDFSKLPSAPAQTGVGGFIGVVSAIFGIGGGTLTVPFLSSFGLKIQHAVGTSAACGFPIALAGSLGFLIFGTLQLSEGNTELPSGVVGFVHLYAFVCIGFASFLSAPYGAKLAHKLPADKLKKAFACLLILVGTELLYSSL